MKFSNFGYALNGKSHTWILDRLATDEDEKVTRAGLLSYMPRSSSLRSSALIRSSRSPRRSSMAGYCLIRISIGLAHP